jgi:catechol 2,3-dioxygenase-like lactoylglutathione lyase family enzyme
MEDGPVEGISAVTLLTHDMRVAVSFYESLGFRLLNGGPTQDFTTLRAGEGFLNLQLDAHAVPFPTVWGRVIVYVDDVDAMHERARQAGWEPTTAPADAPWGERYFHIRDPDGHELSFARPLGSR